MVDDDGVVLKGLFIKGQQSAFECWQRIAVVGDAACNGAGHGDLELPERVVLRDAVIAYRGRGDGGKEPVLELSLSDHLTLAL